MGGRIRTIKPEILENERTARLSHEGWRLFVSMITLSDDYGNLTAAADRLRAAAFWGRPTATTLDGLLQELVESELVVVYVARGLEYAHIIGWDEHQRVEKKGKPKVPGPEGGTPRIFPQTSGSFPEESGNPPGTVADSSPSIPGRKGREGKGVEGKDVPKEQSSLPLNGAEGQEGQRKPKAKKTDSVPLPFRPDDVQRTLADASKGRYVSVPLQAGPAISLTKAISAGKFTLADVQLAGEWLGAGGDSWKSQLDCRNLADLDAWIAQAKAWHQRGRPRTNARDPRIGHAPAPTGHNETSEDATDEL